MRPFCAVATRRVGAAGAAVTVTVALLVTDPTAAVTLPLPAVVPAVKVVPEPVVGDTDEPVTSPGWAGARPSCSAADGWPAVSACGPVAKDSTPGGGGGAPPVGVTANSHVRHDVDEVEPPARLYWLPSHTLPTLPVAAGSG